jgi:hypothetical protein
VSRGLQCSPKSVAIVHASTSDQPTQRVRLHVAHPPDGRRLRTSRRCIHSQSPWTRPIGRTDGINHGTTSLSGSRAARTHGIMASSGTARALADFSPELSAFHQGPLSVQKLVERAKIMLDCRVPRHLQIRASSGHSIVIIPFARGKKIYIYDQTITSYILDQDNPLCWCARNNSRLFCHKESRLPAPHVSKQIFLMKR